VAATVATAGAAAPVVASLGADGVVTVYGVSTVVFRATAAAAFLVYLQEQLFAAITGALNAGHFKTQNALLFILPFSP